MKIFIKIIFLVVLLFHISLEAQKVTAFKKYKELSRPEKYWVLKHPLIAIKAWKITQEVIRVTDSVAYINTLDHNRNGGQVDAFRHAYWMASLVQRISWRKALKLGKAHEKGNYFDFLKHHLEDGALPDKADGDMDLFNNEIGIKFGRKNKHLSETDIQIMIIDAIIVGKMKIIKKDSLGNFLDEKNNIIIADSLKGRWDNGKCLVNSNKKIEMKRKED